MFKRNKFFSLGFVLLMSCAALQALPPNTATANLTSTATVTASCLIAANPMAFGAYDPLTGGGQAVFQTTTISVQCTNGMDAPPITMDQGQNPQTGSTGTTPLRQMINGAALLTYNLYSEDSYAAVWGTAGITSPNPNGAAQNMTVYGKIDGGQTTVPAGNYTDTVVVTVTF